MKVIILAGGFGTRLQEETGIKPKPMVEIGGRPILWHIMNIYAASGYREFIIALGYKGEVIKNYFLNYYNLHSDFSVCLGDGHVEVKGGSKENWVVHLVETGLQSHTGGRIKRLSSLIGNETFMVTYGDGVANINIRDLIAFHKKHRKLATITAVRPPARFGGLKFNGDLVTEFVEKPQIGEGWINGGFFVFDPQILEYIDEDHTILEKEPLEHLAFDRQLVAFRHDGFWQCMDTMRDVRLLDELWASGNAPWMV